MPVAFVVLKRPEAMSAQDVKALFDGQLAAYKHPHEVVFTEALPRSAIGKVQVDELRRWLRGVAAGRLHARAPVACCAADVAVRREDT